VRQLRAEILRELLKRAKIPLQTYENDDRFLKALKGLEKEGLCRIEGQYLLIP